MPSIWTESIDMPQFPALDADLTTDVLVIGGGLAGLLCAHALDAAGIRYALIEADRILSGVSCRTTAKITVQHRLIYDSLIRRYGLESAQLYAQANLNALTRYSQLAQNIDCDFEEKDAYVYSRAGTDNLERELIALERVGLRAEYADSLPLPIRIAGAIRMPAQAQLHPLKFAGTLAKGLNIYEHTAARAWDGHAVITDSGRITAEKIIVATHFPMFNKHGAYFLKLCQHRSYVLALTGAQDVGGMYVDCEETGLSFRNQGNMLLLGGGGHRTGKPGGGWKELAAFSGVHYPDAHEIARWATQDCMSLDGIPYVGQYAPGKPDLFVATGFNKWGLTGCMAAALLLCDLIQGRKSDYAALFSPSRSMLHPSLAVNSLEAALSLLTPSKPRCPHMGCALKWNAQEHSWDCPCHGSRFDEDGKLLSNPATGNLQRAPHKTL